MSSPFFDSFARGGISNKVPCRADASAAPRPTVILQVDWLCERAGEV